jgi:CRISPR-associated endonuclease/helicase Cas3
VLPYHSRFPRISRHFIEIELDAVLNRKKPDKVFEQPTIQEHLKKISKRNVIFIVVSTPVEEVGRDHDFDWAVIEPSSMRSLVQMSGRVVRHREIEGLEAENVYVLSHNVRALLNKKIAYVRPGYESTQLRLNSHDMRDLLDEEAIKERIDSGLRISRVRSPQPQNNLLHLEHVSLHAMLTAGEVNDYTKVPGWIHGPYYLTGIAQSARPFRHGSREESFFIFSEEPDLRLKFYKKDDSGKFVSSDQDFQHESLSRNEKVRLWSPVVYYYQLENIGRYTKLSINQAAARFGEISVPNYMLEPGQKKIKFNPDLGLWQERDFGKLFG